MANVEQRVNGPANGEFNVDNYDPDDPEFQRQLWRRPDIEQDMKEMERRKRVETIMNSQMFREELERIIDSQMNEGYGSSSLTALQQVSDLLLPHASRISSALRTSRCLLPINDIRGVDGLRYAKGEKILRCKLASVYRLVDLYGWSDSIYNHITARVSQDQEHFLLNPFGLQYHEITASSLLKVDMQGNVIDSGSSNFNFNRAGFMLHSAIHAARPDIRAIIHIHYPPCVAVSATKCGLLPISQEAAIIGDVSYHDYQGILVNPAERETIARNLGPINKVMFLRNHGIVVCGESLEEAVFLLRNVVTACETQVRLMPLGIENIQVMSEEAQQKVRDVVRSGGQQVQGKPDDTLNGDEDKERAEPKEKPRKARVLDLEFEAQMRMLDNAGFRSGYGYRHPMLRSEAPRVKNDVEIPPAASSITQFFEEDKWLSPLKKLLDGRKSQDQLRWINSPNVYQKVEILESGTSDPKKITKWVEVDGNGDSDSWVQEGSPTHSTSVKIDNTHQFLPKNTGDPKEFKRKQKEIKANRMKSTITAGPQSHILEGVTWEEAKNLQDARISSTGDQVILVGAASKGIIQREFQHNAMVYKSAYAKNPFDNITDQELEEYRRIVEKKQRGEPVEEEVPEEIKHLLVEPIAIPEQQQQQPVVTTPADSRSPPHSPTSPVSEDEGTRRVGTDTTQKYSQQKTPEPQIIVTDEQSESISHKVEAAEREREKYFQRRAHSERKPKQKSSDTAVNGEKLRSTESGDVSAASRSSKEGSLAKDISEGSMKKEKKKKKGLRTPSFLKKKKHKKEKEDKEKSTA
ncbi:protein hu-li tai shao-like isoform X4 [Limulus polyphemus]|uniref:Protein hu-li tai shao-like isoform X4 n=1 Tax=Limulus polyphemus TaxID=6850 RepID=A0ABM1TFC8_LIMPO|nr:protein hu-li tai shao-like isoform X4 [Limulus polyphemus]